MAVRLTENAIAMLSTGQWDPAEVQPVLQLTECRNVPARNSSVERYRLVLSDGSFAQQAMLATQQNDLVRSQQLQTGSIVQLNQFIRNIIQDRVVFIILNLEVIHPICEMIGNPKNFPFGSSSEPQSPMQPFNQPPPTTTNSPQTFMGNTSIPRPANSPIYPPQHDHNTGSHSYNYGSPLNNPSPPSFTRSPTTTSYIRPVQLQPTYNQHSPMYTNRGPTGKTEPPARTIPINALNPYQGRWTIKARVTSKGELRHYNNAKGDGKLFSFDLLDSESGEIRVTCFNNVADQFYNQIEKGKVYLISKGTVKPASKAFNHLKNEHEITLDNSSTIQTIEDDSSIPHQQFHFRKIAEIENMENYSVLDVIGVVSSITPASTLTTKKGTEAVKRTLQLKDMSGKNVEVTLWGNFCTNEGQTLQSICDSGTFPIVAIKAAKVSDFNGKTLGTISTSQVLIDPEFVESRNLKSWFDTVGRNSPSVSLSIPSRPDSRKTISQIKDEKLGTNEKPDWITINATINSIRLENLFYNACPNVINDRKCSKKVTDSGDGKWRCERCEIDVDECDYRYILSICIMDHTGLIWVTAFQESGEEITGVSAKELHKLRYEEDDDEKFTQVIRNVLHSRFNFKLKVKEESYNDEARVKSTVVKAEKIKCSNDTSFYLESLMKEVKPKMESVIPIPMPIPPNVGIRDSGGFNGQYGNQYGGGRGVVGGSCGSCGGVGHSSVNCPSVGSGQGYSQRFNSHGVGNATSAYGGTGGGVGGGNVGQGRYGGVAGQYVGGY